LEVPQNALFMLMVCILTGDPSVEWVLDQLLRAPMVDCWRCVRTGNLGQNSVRYLGILSTNQIAAEKPYT
jgi:hypothetical protein